MKFNLAQKISFFFSLLILGACADEESHISSIPYARVEIDINTILNHQFNNAYYSQIYYSNKNGFIYAGYAGVIVTSNVDGSWIYAYDLCCPNDIATKKELLKRNDIQMECPTCKSVFNIGDGTGLNVLGPAKEKLRRYNVTKSSGTYRIRN